MRKLTIFLAVLTAIGVAIAASASGPDNRSFSGRVLTIGAKPIEGAEVSAYVRDGGSLNSRLKATGSSATTDKSGNFRMSDLKPSVVYTIVVRARGYERQKWNAIGCRYLAMRLRPAKGSISGRVEDRDGNPVQGVWVKVGLGIDSLYTCRSGVDGGFRFTDLIPDAMITVCVGGDDFKKSARVGDKGVTVMVDPNRVKDFKPVFPDNNMAGSILDILKSKLSGH